MFKIGRTNIGDKQIEVTFKEQQSIGAFVGGGWGKSKVKIIFAFMGRN